MDDAEHPAGGVSVTVSGEATPALNEVLPRELLRRVLAALEPTTLALCTRVCRLWLCLIDGGRSVAASCVPRSTTTATATTTVVGGEGTTGVMGTVDVDEGGDGGQQLLWHHLVKRHLLARPLADRVFEVPRPKRHQSLWLERMTTMIVDGGSGDATDAGNDEEHVEIEVAEERHPVVWKVGGIGPTASTGECEVVQKADFYRFACAPLKSLSTLPITIQRTCGHCLRVIHHPTDDDSFDSKNYATLFFDMRISRGVWLFKGHVHYRGYAMSIGVMDATLISPSVVLAAATTPSSLNHDVEHQRGFFGYYHGGASLNFIWNSRRIESMFGVEHANPFQDIGVVIDMDNKCLGLWDSGILPYVYSPLPDSVVPFIWLISPNDCIDICPPIPLPRDLVSQWATLSATPKNPPIPHSYDEDSDDEEDVSEQQQNELSS
ncbi:hypothetical protein Pelo_6269 [Pelomyxa schiedti]|nr:hypothetical protein Pelo_6269 [Pelomyxa schiedti]